MRTITRLATVVAVTLVSLAYPAMAPQDVAPTTAVTVTVDNS